MKYIFIFTIVFSLTIACRTAPMERGGDIDHHEKNYASTRMFQLSVPVLEIDSNLFKHHATVVTNNENHNIQYRYTIDGTEPTLSNQTFEHELKIEESCILSVRAFHPEYQTSESRSVDLYKITKPINIKLIEYNPPPHEKYAFDGWTTHADMRLGSTNFSNSEWLGFDAEKLYIKVYFEEQNISTLSIGFLQNHGAWIFWPKQISLIVGSETITEKELATPMASDANKTTITNFEFDNVKTDHITIHIEPLQEIPEWHAGHGTNPWTFIDEIIIE